MGLTDVPETLFATVTVNAARPGLHAAYVWVFYKLGYLSPLIAEGRELLHLHKIEMIREFEIRPIDALMRKVMQQAVFRFPPQPTFADYVRFYAQITLWTSSMSVEATGSQEQLALIHQYQGRPDTADQIEGEITQSDERAKRYEYAFMLEMIELLFGTGFQNLVRWKKIVRGENLTPARIQRLDAIKARWERVLTNNLSFTDNRNTLSDLFQNNTP
jgi:hypothetical protein